MMIVITDGESHDSPDLQQAIEDCEKDDITRYAIAVSLPDQFLTGFMEYYARLFLGFLVANKFSTQL